MYPQNIYCICCDAIIDKSCKYGLCNNCIENIHWNNKNKCQKCGRAIYVENDNLCSNCKMRKYNFDKGYSVTSYGKYEKSILTDFKLLGKSYLGINISEMLQEYISYMEIDFDVLAFVPILPNKVFKRGFNQSKVLAKQISEKFKKPVLNGLYKKPTKKDNKLLSLDERFENIRDSFGYKGESIVGKKILLVDDVYTTGATVSEVSKILKKNGAKNVDFLVFSSGLDRGNT